MPASEAVNGVESMTSVSERFDDQPLTLVNEETGEGLMCDPWLDNSVLAVHSGFDALRKGLMSMDMAIKASYHSPGAVEMIKRRRDALLQIIQRHSRQLLKLASADCIDG